MKRPAHISVRRGFALVRAALVLGLALTVLVATTGVLPSPGWLTKVGARATGERYPCEVGLCGCVSARECWTTCNCHTLAQKIRWAEREGVDVPSYVRTEGVDVKSAPNKPACPLCEAAGHGDAAQPDDAPPEEAPSSHARADAPSGLPTLSALGCKGITLLMAIPAPVVTAPDVLGSPLVSPRGVRVEVSSERAPRSRVLEAPLPPPRGRAV